MVPWVKAFVVQMYGPEFASPEPPSTPQQLQPSCVKTGEPEEIMG